jgi:hypothetical protein
MRGRKCPLITSSAANSSRLRERGTDGVRGLIRDCAFLAYRLQGKSGNEGVMLPGHSVNVHACVS